MDILTELFNQTSDLTVRSFETMMNKFKSRTRYEYVYKFISTFMDVEFMLGGFINDLRMKKFRLTPETAEQLISQCHNAIDNTSLSEPEIIFFHKLVDCNAPNEEYIATLKMIYHDTENLQKCQLGKSIWRCLELSTNIQMTDNILKHKTKQK